MSSDDEEVNSYVQWVQQSAARATERDHILREAWLRNELIQRIMTETGPSADRQHEFIIGKYSKHSCTAALHELRYEYAQLAVDQLLEIMQNPPTVEYLLDGAAPPAGHTLQLRWPDGTITKYPR